MQVEQGVADRAANVYAPPVAPVRDVATFDAATEFHVVSLRKFWLLYIGTLGLYGYYWRYRHWARYRARHRETLWPIARAIFAVFFAHALNRHIDESLRESRATHRWSPGTMATLFVVFAIATRVLDRLVMRVDAVGWLDAANLAMLLPLGWTMTATQRAANVACGDVAGAGNARLTWANWIWLVIGLLAWSLIAIGFLVDPQDLA